MLLGTLVAILLGNLLTGKGTSRTGEGIIRAGYSRPSTSASQNKVDF